MKKELAVFTVLILVGGCIAQTPEGSTSAVNSILAHLKGLSIEEFFEQSYKQLLLRNPQKITELGLAEEYGLRNDQLNNISDAYIRETQALEKGILELLRTYDRAALTPEQQVSYDVYEWHLDDVVRQHEFMYYNYLVHHFLGDYHDELVRFFTEIRPLANKEDAEDYIACLSQIDTQVSQLIEGLRLRKEAGVVPPRFILEMTKGIYRSSLYKYGPDTYEAEHLILYSVFSEKVNALNLSAEEKQALLDAALTEITESFIPAYEELIAYIEVLEATATDDAGIWKFPHGDEYYTYILRHETSTDLTAEEIHEMGLQEVDRIQKEMRAVFDELGYPEDENLSDLVNRAIMEGGFYDISTKAGKDQLVETYEAMLDEMSQLLKTVVDLTPSAGLVVVGESNFCGGGFYVSASLDGSRPGAFHTGMGCSLVPRFNAPTVAYHEAIPGHHFQIAVAQELDLPLFRNDVFFNGYTEGWALYAERLAWELGVYDDSAYGNIGRLQLELLRAVRLVTDTGIHAKHWTREEAKTYMREALGDPTGGLAHEVDRYIVLPGQATGYMVGMLKILELRSKAMDELGDKFDIKEFHRVILGSGSVPLEILERIVQDYIDKKLGNDVFLGNLMFTLSNTAYTMELQCVFVGDDVCECCVLDSGEVFLDVVSRNIISPSFFM